MLSVSQSEPIQTVDPEFNADPSPCTGLRSESTFVAFSRQISALVLSLVYALQGRNLEPVAARVSNRNS